MLFFTLIGPLTFWPAFCASTMHPLSRYPVFVMGMLGGELVVRNQQQQQQQQQQQHDQQHQQQQSCNTSHRHDDIANGDRDMTKHLSGMPWVHLTFLRLFPLPCAPLRPCCITSPPSSSSSPQQPSSSFSTQRTVLWSHRAVSQSVRLLLLTIGVILMSIWTPIPFGDPMAFFWIKVGAVWWQAMVPFAQLEVILALGQPFSSSSHSQQSTDHQLSHPEEVEVPTSLTCSTTASNTTSISTTTTATTGAVTATTVLHKYLVLFLCHPYLQILGQYSMNIYLVHWLVLKYVTWGVNRGFVPLPWPESVSCDDTRYICITITMTITRKRFLVLKNLPLIQNTSSNFKYIISHTPMSHFLS